VDLAGVVETPTISLADGTTLNVDGSLQAGAGTAATLTGSAGANIVTVGADGNLLASGDLGAGNDVLDVAGTLDTGGGSFALGDGDDILNIHDNTNIIGSVSAGLGTDTFATDIGTIADVGGVQGFETLTKTGIGTLNFNGPTGSDFTTVNVLVGILNINAAASFAGVSSATVANGATMNVHGGFGFTAGGDTFTVAGAVAGAGAIDMLDGDDQLTLQDGADLGDLTNAIDGGVGNDTLTADIIGNATLGGAINFETLIKSSGGMLNIDGPANSQFNTVLVQGGTLYIAAGAIVDPETTVVDPGTTMTVDGTYEGTAGNDTFTVSGTVNGSGTINLLAGDDLLTLNDGADINGLVNPLDGGDHGSGDTVALNNDGALDLDITKTVNFEFLQKTGTGTATLTGTQAFTGGTTINSGTLDVDGTLETGNMSLLDGTTLNVDGVLNGGPGVETDVLGGDGIETVRIGADGSMFATGNLGGGNDVLDVFGTLDATGLSSGFQLGDGNDTFTIHDETVVQGTVDGGVGMDTFSTNIATVADLGAVNGFEALDKTGAGTLNVNGPAVSDFSLVTVNGGTLNVAAGGSIVAATGGVLDTTIASGATLKVDGSYGCGAGNDTMSVSGIVSGSGIIDLCGGDDTLTLNDGAVLNNVIGGGDNEAGDTVVLNNTGAFTFNAGNAVNFEYLQKDNTGTATMTGTQVFGSSTTINGGTLDVDGTLNTANVNVFGGTLNVDGVVQGLDDPEDPDPNAAANLFGDEFANTVTIGDGGLLFASGDLGAGNDVLEVFGTLDTNGNSFSGVLSLGDGDDLLTLHDGAEVNGVVHGGDGSDSAVADIDDTADLGALMLFEVLTKTGSGTLNITGDTVGDNLFPSSIQNVNVLEGTLYVGPDAIVVAPADPDLNPLSMSTVVANGATLNVDGSFGCGDANDTMTVGGTVTGSGTIDLCGGDDTLTLNDGANLSGLVNALSGGDGTDTVLADITGNATLGGVINFETLTKTNTGTLNVDGPAASAFTTVNVDGGTLDIGILGAINGVVTTTVAGGATLNVDGSYTGSAGNDSFDVSGTVAGIGTIDLAAGDDTLTLNDGAALNNVIDGGAHGTGDTVVLNNAGALTFDAGNTINFETLRKDNAGTATLSGTQAFSAGTAIDGGTLDVDGALTTPTVTLADDTTLNVDGVVQGTGGTAATITGSTGINTVTVNGMLTAVGNLGEGSDVLDVFGTLDATGSPSGFQLGDGDDNFIVHDGTSVSGTIDGGAGLDTRAYDINLEADLGALLNFEGVTKTGTGILNINGPGTTDLQEVSVLGGTLNIGPAGSVVATAGSTLTTVVGSGATLNVDGSYGCGAGNDTMSVSGIVSGSGTIDLCGGDDTLTLNDGAVLNNLISGGAHAAGDTVVLNNAAAMTFDGANTTNFEFLTKDNVGVATLVGTSTFSGGTTLNAGTLDVDGTLNTPTVALGDATTLNVDGTLQAAAGTAATLTGSAGTNTVSIGAGGTLLASGDLGAGNDVLDVAGTLDTAGGIFALGDGDDTLTIHDGTSILGTVVAGAGNDTFNSDIATGADLGAVQGFETLSKTNVGVLNINGPMSSDFTTVNVLAGTLNVGAGGNVSAQTTTVAAGSTLQIAGSYTGTSGNDSFVSRGTVVGALAFGDGNDAADFIGGDVSGLTALDGGAGSDRLGFSGLTLDGANLPALIEWERVELLSSSSLTLGRLLDLSGGVLAIDATSQLFANAGARIGGNVENAGLINVGSNRLGISGGYSSNNGALNLMVSPGSATSGGLDITGDVTGTTAVTFDGDGTEVVSPQEPTSILVIASPNDDLATAGGFTPANAVDGIVRVTGSVAPWTFGQLSDKSWYLSTEAAGVLPEIPGYAVLPSVGLFGIQENNRLLFQRLSGVRSDTPQCGAEDDENKRAYWLLTGDCQGFWMAATGSELEMGANPGFAFSGDSLGMYIGADVLLQDRGTRTLRGGAFAGFQRGNYWTTGANSTDLPGTGESNVRMDTPTFGLYSSTNWRGGSYVDVSLMGQLPKATVAVADGFNDQIVGNSLTLSTQIGHSFHLDNGWTVEPQVQLSAIAMKWQDKQDASGKQLAMDDDVLGTARVAVRAEKVFEMAGGARIRPWATVGLQDTTGEKQTALRVMLPGSTTEAQAFPNHAQGLTATLDMGVEAELNESVSLFGVLSYGESMEGTNSEQRQANVGIRIRW
jgi:fibronectin-binding autotransporter adhesin